MIDIPDTGQEWPFHFSKVPYRPVDEQDWREGVLRSLHRALASPRAIALRAEPEVSAVPASIANAGDV